MYSTDNLNIQKLKISDQKSLASSSENKGNQVEPIKRPDQGGRVAVRTIRLLANHYRVRFDPKQTILHYDVDVKPMSSSSDDNNKRVSKKLRKSEMRIIKDKYFSGGNHQFMTAYDGEKNIFSAVRLPEGRFKVDISEGEEVKSGSYMFTIKLVNELQLSKLNDYIRGNVPCNPRDILQGMDSVMKENPTRKRINVGRSFYSHEHERGDELGFGLAAYKGLQQSLKPTLQGLALCSDYSILAFRKPVPVLEFLAEHFYSFQVQDVKRLRKEVASALKGLKVTVTHRRTKQKYVIGGLTEKDTRYIDFYQEDVEGKRPPQRTMLVDYFKSKWGKDIMYQNIPSLELGKGNRSNAVPLEFCVLVEGQRYPKEYLDKDTAALLKKITLAHPSRRRNTINEMVQGDDGPCGYVILILFSCL